jgi:MerR family transcriptional regulator, light-induced transcriptional regulator
MLFNCCIVRRMGTATNLRIGELSRRSGVSPALLRAWERRYGLLQPARSAGGLRLYSLDDVARVRRMQGLLADGVAAAEAAALVSAAPAEERPPSALPAAVEELTEALEGFDEARAHAVIDRLLAATTVDALLTQVFLPYLHELGERWERGETSIAQEHFASGVVRGRLLGLARGWGRGLGPLALLACVPGERHELGLIAFGLALRGRGWRIVYLGADTPLETIERTVGTLAPSLVVLTATTPDRLQPLNAQLRELAAKHLLALGGSGVSAERATEVNALALTENPVEAAERVTELVRARNER